MSRKTDSPTHTCRITNHWQLAYKHSRSTWNLLSLMLDNITEHINKSAKNYESALCGTGSTVGACLHAVRAVEGKEAPLVDAVPAKPVNVCRPAEATVDLQPGRRQCCPLRVRLPSAVEHNMGWNMRVSGCKYAVILENIQRYTLPWIYNLSLLYYCHVLMYKHDQGIQLPGWSDSSIALSVRVCTLIIATHWWSLNYCSLF